LTSEYFVKLDRFEGPLDLLLHLIRVHEIDIFAIDIFKLSTEYLSYLRLMKFDDLADAGAFVEMAATLIEIKSRSLLPATEQVKAEGEEEEEDPVKALQERLIQYEMIRRAAEKLASMPQLGVEIQSNHEWRRLEETLGHIEGPLTGDPATLVVLYEQMLRDFSERKVAKVEAKTHLVSLEQTIEKLAAYVDVARFSLFQGFYNQFSSRYELVVHVLAVLELCRQFKLKFYQQDLMGPLWIYRTDCNESDLPLATTAVPQYSTEQTQPVVEMQTAAEVEIPVKIEGAVAAPVTSDFDSDEPDMAEKPADEIALDPASDAAVDTPVSDSEVF
jgi:segregation and condensation protein A